MEEPTSSRRAVLQSLHFPKDASTSKDRQLLASQGSEEGMLNLARGVHAGLWLDKYIANLERYKASAQRGSEASPQQSLVREVAQLEVPDVYSQFYKHWLQTLTEAGVVESNRREFAVKGRMAVGLGNEGVIETSVSLHRTYGVPYIPGSALKGLAANYARLLAGDDWQQGKDAYKVVFGNTDNAGYVTFFDALYIPAILRQMSPAQPGGDPDRPLRADIITVHHPNYYQGKKDEKGLPVPPADWDSPNPIPFLSATGSYLIALAAPDLDKVWIEKTFDLLEQALLVLGVGAKTSSGYGRMMYGPDDAEVLTEEDQRELQAINVHLEKIQQMLDKQVSGQIRNIGTKCLLLKSPVARKKLAKAIIEKVRQAGQENDMKSQFWYQNLTKNVD